MKVRERNKFRSFVYFGRIKKKEIMNINTTTISANRHISLVKRKGAIGLNTTAIKINSHIKAGLNC